MELTKFIETHIVWSFVIGFFTLLLLIFIFFWQSMKKHLSEFVETHVVADYDDQPYQPLKKVNNIEVDVEVLDNVSRHNQED